VSSRTIVPERRFATKALTSFPSSITVISQPVTVAGDGLNNISVRIQEQETARRRGTLRAIVAGKTSNQYESDAQNTESRRKALLLRVALEEEATFAGWVESG
jgi:hypothetical protein